MSLFEICRICLRSNVKMFPLNQFSLKMYYEEIMVEKLPENDTLPQFFCYECATMLHKAYNFKSKCYRGQKILEEILFAQCPITYHSVGMIDKKFHDLESPINLTKVTKRVKTYTAYHQPLETSSSTDEIPNTAANTEEVDKPATNNDDILDKTDSVDDKNDIVELDSEPDDDNNDNIALENYNSDTKIDPLNDNCDFENENNDILSDGDDVEVIAQTVHEPEKENLEKQSENAENNEEKVSDPLAVKLNDKKTRRKKKTINTEKKYKFKLDKERRILNPKFWQKITMNEEEAFKRFHEKARESYYTKAKFKCINCYKGFSKQEMLDRHNELRHQESLGEHECRLCHMRFRLPCLLGKHIKRHYVTYRCLRCSIMCPLEGTAFMHDDFHSGRKLVCAHCGKEFRQSSTYYTHLRTHRSEHLCTICGASFVSELGLHLHKKTKHVPSEVVKQSIKDDNTYCDTCDIKFVTRDAYDQHLFHSDKHTDFIQLPSSATKKLQSVKLKEQITKNMRRGTQNKVYIHLNAGGSHLGRKPTKCNMCGVHFDTQAAFYKHHRKEHPGTSMHSPNDKVICEICGKSLSPFTIQTHLNVHTKQKVFPCETCGKTFYVFGVMKRHQLTHSDFKPEECTLCDKRFKQPSSLALHYKTYHLKQPYPKRNRNKKRQADLYDHEDVYPFEKLLNENRR